MSEDTQVYLILIVQINRNSLHWHLLRKSCHLWWYRTKQRIPSNSVPALVLLNWAECVTEMGATPGDTKWSRVNHTTWLGCLSLSPTCLTQVTNSGMSCQLTISRSDDTSFCLSWVMRLAPRRSDDTSYYLTSVMLTQITSSGVSCQLAPRMSWKKWDVRVCSMCWPPVFLQAWWHTHPHKSDLLFMLALFSLLFFGADLQFLRY